MNEPGVTGVIRRAIADLIDAELTLGSNLLGSLTGVSVTETVRSLRGDAGKCGCGCCRVPEPCWMPQPLGDVISHASQCRTACIRFVVTNCDVHARSIQLTATGSAGKDVVFTPANLALGPMERATVRACIKVPDDAKDGARLECVLWLHGSRAHFLRWTVSVATIGLPSLHEIAVDDCPDLVHHWYDHFYCRRRLERETVTAVSHG